MNNTTILYLKGLIGGINDAKTLRETIKVKEWQFDKHTKRLLDGGFIKKDDNVITLQNNAKVALLKEVSQKYDLENILRGANELVFLHLAEPHTLGDLVSKTGLSTTTIHRAISDLEAAGAIKRSIGTKSQSNRVVEMMSLDMSKTSLVNFARVLSSERDMAYEPDAEIIHKDNSHMLTRVPSGKIADGELTAFSLFNDYGISYDSPFDYYVRQEDPLNIHDVIIHSIMAAYKANDGMGIIMTMVFYLHNKDRVDALKLKKLASSFAITNAWLDVESYLRRQKINNSELFLPWNEFIEKARLYDVDPSKYTLPQPTQNLFPDIGRCVTKPTRIYLIGGENMRIKTLKPTTKDCDIVVESVEDFEALKNVLIDKLQYKQIDYTEEDKRIYPTTILKHSDRSRIDLFTRQIAQDMSLSDVMIQTADYQNYGSLKVGILRNEYIFLLKAVAGREGDINDMAALVQGSVNQPKEFIHGTFDWGVVWQELIHQEKINPLRNLTECVLEQLEIFTERTGIAIPFFDTLRRHVLDQKIVSFIRGGRQPLDKLVKMLAGSDLSEQMIRNRIDALVKEGTIAKNTVGKKVIVTSTNQTFPRRNWTMDSEHVDLYLRWRFPIREHSLPSAVVGFTEEIASLGYSIADMDEAILNQLDNLADYESKYFTVECKSVGAARICMGLSDPKLGNNGKSNFYIIKRLKDIKMDTSNSRLVR